MLLLCLHQFELSFINWTSVGFPTLGAVPSMLMAGTLHVLLCLTMLLVVYFNPMSTAKKRN